MGRCCRICDRKFFLQALFQQYAAQINYYAQESQDVEEQLNQVQAQVDEMDDEKDEIDNHVRGEEQRYQTADVNQRSKLGDVQMDQDQMRQMKETLTQ